MIENIRYVSGTEICKNVPYISVQTDIVFGHTKTRRFYLKSLLHVYLAIKKCVRAGPLVHAIILLRT